MKNFMLKEDNAFQEEYLYYVYRNLILQMNAKQGNVKMVMYFNSKLESMKEEVVLYWIKI